MSSVSNHPLRGTWSSMIARCHSPNNSDYRYYGAVGISVCLRWRRSFQAFVADVGKKPSRRHSLDRYPDKYGNYKPGNVRWATPKQQGNNKRERGSFGKSDKPSLMTSFRLGVDRKLLSKYAKADGTSMTDVIRRLLRDRSEKEDKDTHNK